MGARGGIGAVTIETAKTATTKGKRSLDTHAIPTSAGGTNELLVHSASRNTTKSIKETVDTVCD